MIFFIKNRNRSLRLKEEGKWIKVTPKIVVTSNWDIVGFDRMLIMFRLLKKTKYNDNSTEEEFSESDFLEIDITRLSPVK